MKKQVHIGWLCLSVAAGLSVGAMFGKTGSSRWEEADGKGEDKTFRSRRNHVPAISTGYRSYERLVQHVKRGGVIPREGSDFLARASREEILAMMESSAASHGSDNDWYTNRKLLEAIKAAARELCRRDGLAAVEWVEKKSSSMHLSNAMIAEFTRENPQMGKGLWEGHFRRFGNSRGWDFMNAAMEGAASRSAGDLLAVERDLNSSNSQAVKGFSENFDFKEYLSKTQSIGNVDSAFESWAAADPDAAAEGLSGGLGANADGGQFYGAFKGRAAMVGEDAAAEWILDRMDGLESEKRKEVMRWLTSKDTPGERVQAFINRLPDEKEKLEFAVEVVQTDRQNGNARESIAEHYPEEFRFRVAKAWLDEPRNRGSVQMNELADKMMEDLKIPEPKREALRSMR